MKILRQPGTEARVTIKPTRIDIAIADEIAAHTDDEVEHAANALTWGADEHVLLALAASGWLAMPFRPVTPSTWVRWRPQPASCPRREAAPCA